MKKILLVRKPENKLYYQDSRTKISSKQTKKAKGKYVENSKEVETTKKPERKEHDRYQALIIRQALHIFTYNVYSTE